MSGPGDIGGEVSGDEAAWRDLVARFDVPTDRTTTVVPWPAIEDLPEAPTQPGMPDNAAESPTHRAEAGRPSAKDGAATDSSGRKAEPSAPTADPADASGRAPDPSGWGTDPAAGKAQESPSQSDQKSGPATSFAIPPDRTRVIRPAGSPRSYTPPEEANEDPYLPEPLPPPARLDSTSKAALAGVIGGPGYLIIASIFLHWTISAEAALIAVAAFVGGFVTLVVKLGDRSRRDDDDDGAVL
jgi:hypothetical protein